MLNKKIHSLLLAAIMLISVLGLVTSVNADCVPAHGVKGTIYIDDGIAGPGIEIEIEFYQDETYIGSETATTFEHDGSYNFNIGFEGHEGEKGYIRINDKAPDDSPEPFVEVNCNDTFYYIYSINFSGLDFDSPEKVTGLTVSDAKDGKLDLSWDTGVDNYGIDYYNIYWDQDGYTTPIDTETTTSYQHTGLSNGQTYCYKISAVDNSGHEGEMSDQDCASPSKTSTPPSPPAPPAPPGPPAPPAPPADDDDDDDNDTTTGDDDDDEIIPNNPPEIIDFTGPETGSKNTALNYSATATDPDGHDIKYTFGWDDGTENSTDFMANATQYNTSHTFTSAGVYTIWVQALDDYDNGNGSVSAKEYITVLIDAHIVDTDEADGYLTDDNGNGTYDNFHNDEDDSESGVGTEGSMYLLDTDGDEEYDYKYDPATGTGETIQQDTDDDDPSGGTEPAGEDNTLLYAGAALIVIVLLLLFFLATRKKNKK